MFIHTPLIALINEDYITLGQLLKDIQLWIVCQKKYIYTSFFEQTELWRKDFSFSAGDFQT